MTWQQALKTFTELYAESGLTNEWIIVGSVGSVLQHAVMTPGDLDIYVRNREDVAPIAALFKKYNLKAKADVAYSDPAWLSSDEEPFFTQSFSSGFTWTKGKWKIGEFQVELVHISNSAGIPDSDQGDGIWEGGKYIWELAKFVDFEGGAIPVVPLEIQLESNIRRKRQDRVDAIVQALLVHGWDKKLLEKALSHTNKTQFQPMIQ
ncbi:hypothetical protein SAMN02799630_03374 [Paenibacillus sp. UNCCL117]|uniref:hypothetical protein n=1 Tax=unclassified Paenibacillus TaxID=185978 RepID=UPI00088EE06B|nr:MULTISPECIES: hypothetical protein [unclassified Paenibacillus]SDE44160.1 hypothetical protein SAMN04488602_12846 [Paenibacillus sp. cl123]SFW46185.1 hypothetical protein SAMN02799630_03374 [Paenibacillus sp. UNCCL117]